jgi:hypothetical protein
MNNKMDLNVESLESIEAPLSDYEWGLIAGAAMLAGAVAGAIIAT